MDKHPISDREPDKQALTDLRAVEIQELVIVEWLRQREIWNEQTHGPGKWLLILMEEVGEAAQAFLQGRYRAAIVELIQCMAVLMSWIERASIDHGDRLIISRR